uniref:Switching B cell complex subunit SWAP70 n=1 Tax=Rousettus aegyptiacus TaxID=9407 RepID=A0A7J8H7L1_ROUAE|nr:switching B cell complex subunit SWAP70 [Rousettus aegyptiacus]
MGGLKDELLKAIWHAFTALDLDHSGKVSKSQLKVLSHNLCTVLKVPHDPVALEEHFRDDDEGPVSNQGYMPYLNKFILEKCSHVGLLSVPQITKVLPATEPSDMLLPPLSKTTLTRLNSIGCVGPSVSKKTSQRVPCSLWKKIHLKCGLFSTFYLRTSIH